MEKKLAHQLRDVTEATARLYGNDLQIAERLLSRLLTFETQQSGFGLTATQDAHFNEVKRRNTIFLFTPLLTLCEKHTHTVFFLWYVSVRVRAVYSGGRCTAEAFRVFLHWHKLENSGTRLPLTRTLHWLLLFTWRSNPTDFSSDSNSVLTAKHKAQIASNVGEYFYICSCIDLWMVKSVSTYHSEWRGNRRDVQNTAHVRVVKRLLERQARPCEEWEPVCAVDLNVWESKQVMKLVAATVPALFWLASSTNASITNKADQHFGMVD